MRITNEQASRIWRKLDESIFLAINYWQLTHADKEKEQKMLSYLRGFFHLLQPIANSTTFSPLERNEGNASMKQRKKGTKGKGRDQPMMEFNSLLKPDKCFEIGRSRHHHKWKTRSVVDVRQATLVARFLDPRENSTDDGQRISFGTVDIFALTHNPSVSLLLLPSQ